MTMATYATNLVQLIGLGIAVDYSLLVVYRFREELRGGDSVEEAVVRTMATAGRAVIFSGGTVAIGLALLLFMPVPFMRSMGVAGFLIPLVSLAAAVTLQPALLSVYGRRGTRRIPLLPERFRGEAEAPFWHRLAAAIMRRFAGVRAGTRRCDLRRCHDRARAARAVVEGAVRSVELVASVLSRPHRLRSSLAARAAWRHVALGWGCLGFTGGGDRPLMRTLAGVGLLLLALVLVAPARSSPRILYGIQDDAWLSTGPGSLEERLKDLDALGVDVVRYSLRWNDIAPSGPDPATEDWRTADAVLNGLRAHGIAPVVTLVGTPGWANGGRSPNWAPTKTAAFADFAGEAATRYPWIHDWTIWNEPNQVINLRPTTPATYVRRLLNPAYKAIHDAIPDATVAGGMTAPRAGPSGVSPLTWMRGMRDAHALLDVYAHHPYPGSRFETPFGGGCTCSALTLANLPVLIREVTRDFGPKRIWLTEFAYQTNPPDRLLGVSPARQAALIGESAMRAYELPRVDMLIHFLYRDEPELGRWQSGLVTVNNVPKPALSAFPLPIAQMARHGSQVLLWGQVRPGPGAQLYSLEERRSSGWQAVGGMRQTGPRGFFRATVTAPPGTRFRVKSPAAGKVSFSVALH